MAKTLIDVDSFTGIKTYHDYDHATGTTFVSREQDVESLLKRNKALQNTPEYAKAGKREDYYHFASVPFEVLTNIMKKYDINPLMNEDDLPKLERILSSNEYKYLRTVDKI